MAGQNIIFSHNSGGRAFIRVNGANAAINVAANSTVGSDISTANGTVDPVVGATLTKLIWSTSSNIKISRGANTILTLNGSGMWDLKSMGVALTEFPAAQINVVVGDANSSLLFECTKLYVGGSL